MLNIKFIRFKNHDFNELKLLFKKVYNKNISFDFYKWRYFKRNRYNSFIAKHKNKIVGHIGYVENYFNIGNSKKIFIYSRHSSMVLKEYRNKKIYKSLLIWSLKQLKSNYGILIWPNKINYKVTQSLHLDFKNFTRHNKYSKKIQFNNSENSKKQKIFKKISNLNLNKINFSNNSESILIKDYHYFKWRYMKYDKNSYLAYLEEKDKELNILILQKKIKANIITYYIMDYFGDNEYFYLSIKNLLTKLENNINNHQNLEVSLWMPNNQNEKIKFLLKNNFILTKDKFNILIINPFNKIKKNIHKYTFSMGDTDVFSNINKIN